jgi:hypothetical protein
VSVVVVFVHIWILKLTFLKREMPFSEWRYGFDAWSAEYENSFILNVVSYDSYEMPPVGIN